MRPIESLPKIDPQLNEWAIYWQNQSELDMNILVYAAKRDYLSTPLEFVVVKINPAEYEASFNQLSLIEASDLFEQELKHGNYFCENSEQLLIVSDQQALAISCKSYKVVKRIYHCDCAKQALMQFWQS